MLKILKKYRLQILLVVILLIIRAYTDLSLPSYTSKVVDVGISQSGIEDYTLEVIRESEFNKILEYLTIDEKNIVNSSYTYIEKGSSNLYPILDSESIYVLKENNNDLNSIFLYPLIILSNQSAFEGTDKLEIVSSLKEKYDGNTSLFNGTIINYIKNEYEIIGVNTSKMQNNYIISTGLKMLLVAVISMIIAIITNFLTSKISAFYTRDLRSKLFKKVLSFESEEVNDFSTSSLITRCTNDVTQVGSLLMSVLRVVIYAPIIGIGASIKVYNSGLELIIIVSVILILLLMFTLFILVVPKFNLFQDLLDRITTVSREILSGLLVIRAFSNEKYEEKRFEKENESLTKNGLFVNSVMALMSPTLTFLMNSIAIFLVWFGADKINEGTLNVGSLIAFISYAMQIVTAFLMVSMVLIMLPRAIVSIKRIREVLKKDVSIKESKNAKNIKSIENIEFKDVYFKYKNASSYTLKNISFEAKKGEIIGIIGSTGSGKTTLVNLLLRFFDTSKGKILINNINIKNFKIKELRNKVSYAPQKPGLFSGTIKSNIAFSLKDYNIVDLEKVTKICQLNDFINKKEEKYDYLLSQNASNISGGEKQRLSLSRALIKNGDVLIIDDSMNALDYETDKLIRKELSKLSKDKIIFIVSSRIASVKNAKKIIVLDQGKIIGMGAHKNLLKTCEVYKEIKISQLGE